MNTNKNSTEWRTRPEIIRQIRQYGMMYGLAAGFAFAAASWGVDGYLLRLSHGYLPWTNFLIGVILCMLGGAAAGWLRAWMKHPLPGMLAWLVFGILVAWLTAGLPLEIAPRVVSILEPALAGLLEYETKGQFIWFVTVALIWIAPFIVILGLLQSALVEPAVFSTALYGKVVPIVVCTLVMGIGAVISNSLVSSRFREAIVAMDETIQFVLENRGGEVDPQLRRKMFAASLRQVEPLLNESRRLFIGGFDEELGIFQVLVRMEDQWARCTVVYNQPTLCKLIEE
jgi:hypothetical protein